MAITMGDASGVGPEIVLRRYEAGQLGDDVVVYGDVGILAAGARLLRLDVPIRTIREPSAAAAGWLNVVDLEALSTADFTPARLSAKAGRAAREYVGRATSDALSGAVAGIVTMPMNKEATQLSTPGFVGHTEYIAELCGSPDVAMMLTTNDVAVAHVSAHVSLAEAIRRVTPSRIATVIRLTDEVVRRLGSASRIAVCGLNPHAGENGLLGREDAEIIAPVIAAERARGLDVSGPHPADTVFYQAIHNDRFDAIVCMYHDQGHAPMKLVGFETAVNVTIGLPIVRTSVDHGTAFDIAWQGKAFTGSLQAALDLAWSLAG
ncbi:MAG: 4-hydroxythreonine-4-phosphate dehydrogenase PdxA [Gammaproteobacteria bacterium]|nr:4-hydroxythreonine-4-phosphate dehydrogenase PdxA [Gammaproteobacteria bacterium]